MARYIIKAVTMLALIAGITAVSAGVANGQSRPRLVASVPFDFIVLEKTLRAGEYRVELNQSRDVITIANRGDGERIFRLTYGAAAVKDRKAAARLVFHRYGQTYFLRQVWIESDGRELPQTRQESAIRRELGTIAKYGGSRSPYQVVEVAASFR